MVVETDRLVCPVRPRNLGEFHAGLRLQGVFFWGDLFAGTFGEVFGVENGWISTSFFCGAPGVLRPSC